MTNVMLNTFLILRTASRQRASSRNCITDNLMLNRCLGTNLSGSPTVTSTTENNKLKARNNDRFRPKPALQEVEISHVLSSDRNDPDNFGTLSEDWSMLQTLKSMPEEEDDVEETNFLNNKEGVARLPLIRYAKMIKQFIKQKKIGHAIEVMETRMKEDRAKPDNYIYNLVIAGCGQVGYVRKAFKLYNQMKKRSLKPTKHTYSALFNACANSPDASEGLERATHLRAVMHEKVVPMNQIIYHAMIKAFGRCGDIETAFILVDEMLQNKIKVSNETINFLLQSCISDKEKGFKHGLLVWRKMMDKRVPPDRFTFNLLLRCSRDCGLGDEATAQQLVAVLLHAGQVSQGCGSLAVASGLESARQDSRDIAEPRAEANIAGPNLICRQPTLGQVVAFTSITLPEHRLMLMGGSRGFLEQMRLWKVKPDVKTLTQLLDQIPSNLPAEQELLSVAKLDNIKLDVDFYNMLIRKRCKRGHYEDAKAVLKCIQEENLRPDIMTFGVLAMTCQSKYFAHELLKDIERIGFRPNVEIMGTLLKSACYNRDCDYVIDMMKTLDREELKPNKNFIKHLDAFYKFGTDVINKQRNEGICKNVRLERFDQFIGHFERWKKRATVEEEPAPWAQYQEIHYEPEDLELMNVGKVKYVK